MPRWDDGAGQVDVVGEDRSSSPVARPRQIAACRAVPEAIVSSIEQMEDVVVLHEDVVQVALPASYGGPGLFGNELDPL